MEPPRKRTVRFQDRRSETELVDQPPFTSFGDHSPSQGRVTTHISNVTTHFPPAFQSLRTRSPHPDDGDGAPNRPRSPITYSKVTVDAGVVGTQVRRSSRLGVTHDVPETSDAAKANSPHRALAHPVRREQEELEQRPRIEVRVP